MIRLLALDVDGTLTDGGIYLDGNGGEFKKFHAQDGYGLRQLMESGVEVALISGRYSAATDARARALGIRRCVNGIEEKLPCLREIAAELKIGPEAVAFAGDDVQDIPCIKWARLGIAVANAHPQVWAAADWVTPRSGGAGAVRDAADYILKWNRLEQNGDGL